MALSPQIGPDYVHEVNFDDVILGLPVHVVKSPEPQKTTSPSTSEVNVVLPGMDEASHDEKIATMKYGSTAKTTADPMKIDVCVDQWFMIHPDSMFRRVWEGTILIAILIVIVMVPIGSCLMIRQPMSAIFQINVVLDVLFWIDVVLNCITARWSDDEDALITNRWLIFKQYASPRHGRLIWDLLGLIPADYIALSYHDPFSHDFPESDVNIVYRLLTLFRIIRFVKFPSYFRRLEPMMDLSWIQLRLIKNALLLLLFVHWMACLYYLQAALHNFSAHTWVAFTHTAEASLTHRYTYAVLATLSMVTTNGYGNYGDSGYPQEISELWIMIATQLFGVLFWTATTGTFAVLVLSLDPSGQAYVRRLESLNGFLKHHKLPPRVRASVREHFQRKYHNQLFDEEAILKDLPPSLRRDVAIHVAKSVIKTVPLFRDANGAFLNILLPKLKNEFVAGQEIVLMEDEPPTDLYFVGSGMVALLKNGTKISSCSGGSFFGEFSTIWGIKQPLTAFTRTLCEFFTVSSVEFNAVLDEYDDVRTIFVELAKQRLADWGMQSIIRSPGATRGRPVPVTIQGIDALHRQLKAGHPSAIRMGQRMSGLAVGEPPRARRTSSDGLSGSLETTDADISS